MIGLRPKEYQDPLATMPRICNLEAMSNDRGPAAEGVAHKKIRHRAFRLVWACLIPLSSLLTFLMFLLVVLKGPTPPLTVFVAWLALLFLLLFCVFFSDLLFYSA